MISIKGNINAQLSYCFQPIISGDNPIVPLGLKWSLYDKTDGGKVRLKAIEMANLKSTLSNEIYK